MFKTLLAGITYSWRLASMILLFIIGGLIGCVFGYIYLPLWYFFKRDKTEVKEKVQELISTLFALLMKTIVFLKLMDVEFNDLYLLKGEKGSLFVANHPTFLDYIAIISQLPRCDNIVKEALWRNPAAKRMITLAGYIPNLQSEDTFIKVQESLASENNLLLFPEGTRTNPKKPIKLKRGAAQIAIRLGVPIRLIHVSCKPGVLTKHNKWYKIPKIKPTLSIRVGKKVDAQAFLKESEYPSLAARKLTQYLEEQLAEG